METPFQNNSIFFVDVDKVLPNPFQPRLEFDNAQLESLSESIRMYGVLQPLVVTRKEVFTEEGGMTAQYELIAGERRLRASKLAGMKEVPVVIRSAEQTDQEKLELAIIENLQREDLNPVDRAKAFRLLADDFKLKHAEIGKRVGKSREYVSNSLRLLALPEEMLAALTVKKISEGHARSLLMVGDRPEEQMTLFKEIMLKGLTVRHAEKIARRVAYDKVRKKSRVIDPHVVEVEEEMSEALGTRVHIERKAVGGKIQIDFFSEDDLSKILEVLKQHEGDIVQDEKDPQANMNSFIEQSGGLAAATGMVFEKEQEEAEAQETTVEKEVEDSSFSISEIVSSEKIPEVSASETVLSEEKPLVEPGVKNQESDPVSDSEKEEKETIKPFSYSEVMARPDEPEPDVVAQAVEEEKTGKEEVENRESEEENQGLDSQSQDKAPVPQQEEFSTPLDQGVILPEVPQHESLTTLRDSESQNFNQQTEVEDVIDQDLSQNNQQGGDALKDKPVEKAYQEERQELAEEGIEILGDETPVVDLNAPVQEDSSQTAYSEKPVDYSDQGAPQEYTIKQEEILENKVNPENIQVQSVVQDAQQPLPSGESVQSAAESHPGDLYTNLSSQTPQDQTDPSGEVATPHYGNQSEDEHLYKV